MKKNITIAFLLIPCLIFSQTKRVALNKYFSYYHLSVDSAETPNLYYQVYNWIGAKYKYSGDTKKGIDCSGFTTEIYKHVYCIELTGGSGDIYKHVTPINKMDLKEGDLVFFKIYKGRISHVGIFLGKNKFVHATTQHGVIISDLNEDYYKKYYFKAGRIINQHQPNDNNSYTYGKAN